MAKKLYEETNIQAIANAIRKKNGLMKTYTVSEMAPAVLALSGSKFTNVIFPPVDGWSAHQMFYYGTHSLGTCSFDGGVFTGSATANHGAGMISPLVDLTDTDIIRIEFSASGAVDASTGQFCVYVNSDNKNPDATRVAELVASEAQINAGIVTLDVSQLSGEYYIFAGVDVWSGTTSAECTINKIYLEKFSTIGETISYVTPEKYGAVGDGVTDDTAAIQQAVDENYRIRLGDNKTYRITKSIVLRNGVEFFGGVNTVLKNTTEKGIWKQCLIVGYVGSMEQTTAPSKLPSIGVTVSGNTATGTSLGTSCAVGDIVMIHGSEYVDVPAGSGRYKNYRDFQIERIMSVSGNTITLEHPIDVPMNSYAITVLKDFAIINEDNTLHGFVVSDVYVHDLTFQCALDSSSAWYTVFYCGYNSRFENLRYDNCPSCFGSNLSAYSVFKNISGTTYDSFADMPEYQFRNIYSDWDVVRREHIVNNLMFAVTHGHGNLFRNLRLKTTELTDGPMLSVTHSREITVVGCEFIGNGTGIIIPYHENGRTSVIDGNVFDVEYQAIDVRDKSRNAKITNNIVRSGNLFYLSAAVSDGNGARDRGIYAANNIMAGREPIEESINTQIQTSSPISLFSGSCYPVVGDCIETEFITDSANSLIFSVKLGSKTQTLNAITHPAGYFRAGIYFIANSLYRFVYTDNSGGYSSQICKGINNEENSIRNILITVNNSSGASISGYQISRKYIQNQYGYAILGQGEDSTIVEPEPPAEVIDTVIFPPTSNWEFSKVMEQPDSIYTLGTCEYVNDTFDGRFRGANKGIGIKLVNKIDLSGFNTLHIEFSCSELSSGSQFNVYVQNTMSVAGDVIDHVATSDELASGVIDLDISNINGSYYIVIGAIAWYNRVVSLTITNVTLKGGTTA